MKWMLPLIFSALMVVSLFAFVGIRERGKHGVMETDREMLVMRTIANKLLLQTGDSSSRVLPIKQLAKNEFLISFESSFSFTPDSLVKVIDRQIALYDLPGDYIVKVLDCQTEAIIYGYGIFKSKQQDIVPCLGREQPKKNYCINIKFEEPAAGLVNPFSIAGLTLLLTAIFIGGWWRYKKTRLPLQNESPVSLPEETDTITIGAYSFLPGQQLLLYGNEPTTLTQKEARLLGIFAAAPNQVIDRNRLQKEVWEDEGVIVGRSLDMFISRLRKKLENDPSVKLANIHGKGYRLEIS